jgi:hypothetical protein
LARAATVGTAAGIFIFKSAVKWSDGNSGEDGR